MKESTYIFPLGTVMLRSFNMVVGDFFVPYLFMALLTHTAFCLLVQTVDSLVRRTFLGGSADTTGPLLSSSMLTFFPSFLLYCPVRNRSPVIFGSSQMSLAFVCVQKEWTTASRKFSEWNYLIDTVSFRFFSFALPPSQLNWSCLSRKIRKMISFHLSKTFNESCNNL